MRSVKLYACGRPRSQAKEELERFAKRYYNINLDVKDTSVKGWNWGDANVQGKQSRVPTASPVLRAAGEPSA